MTSSSLTQLLDRHVRTGRLPGAVAAVASGPDLEVAVVGARDVDGPPMTRDTIFRIASNSKPITAAATMLLVDEGRLGLDDPVGALAPRAGVADGGAHPGSRRSTTWCPPVERSPCATC